MSNKLNSGIAVIGIDIGKNWFHVVGQDRRGAMMLRQKWSRGQVERRLANLPPCLIGMEACVGAHHLSRKLRMLGHDARLMPAKYVRPYSKGQKNDFRDAEAIAEAVQRPTMKFVATKTAEQLDLQALHRVRERLVSQRTGIINQIRAFLLERGIAVRQGLRFLRAELPRILAAPAMSCRRAWLRLARFVRLVPIADICAAAHDARERLAIIRGYFARRYVTLALPPIDGVGLKYVTSSPSNERMRVCVPPVKFGNVLPSMLTVSTCVASSIE